VSWVGLADLGLDFVALLVRSRIGQLLAQLLPLSIALPPAAYLPIAFSHSFVFFPSQTDLSLLAGASRRTRGGLDLNPRLYMLLALRSNGWTRNGRIYMVRTYPDGFCSFPEFDIISAYADRVGRGGALSARQSLC
jgi:hypothetical protein